MNRALVLGGGSCLWTDTRALSGLIGGGRWPWTVLAVNDAGWAYRFTIHHWVTLHGEKLPTWKAMREQAGYSMDFETWGGTWRTGRDESKLEAIDRTVPVDLVGSSGMHAVEVALHLGADRVVVAGIPMDGGGHFWDPTPWDSAMMHREPWESAKPIWGDRVRSMSGWTADLLGVPDRGWLDL